MVKQEQICAIRGEEHDLSVLQKPRKEVVLEDCLAFKGDLAYVIVKVRKQVHTNARLTSYDSPSCTLR